MNNTISDIKTLNVDTVEFSVTGVKFNHTYTSKAMLLSADDELFYTHTNRHPIKNRHSCHSLHVRYKERPGEKYGELSVEGSPYAFLYGQNIYTSALLRRGCVTVLRKIQEQLGFEVMEGAWERWQSGDIALRRVDLAANFRLQSMEQVGLFLDQLAHQMVGQNCQVHLHGKYVSWTPRGGSDYAVTAYDKGSQVRSTTKAYDKYFLKKIIKECESMLRIEIRLRHSELRRLNLDKVKNWNIGIARDVYAKYFARLPMFDIVSGPLSVDDLEQVPIPLRPAYIVHKVGIDLHHVYSERTVSRYRNKFRDLGIDLRCSSAKSKAISIATLFSESSICRTPKWLIDAGMAPKRKRRKVAPKRTKTKARRTSSRDLLSLDVSTLRRRP